MNETNVKEITAEIFTAINQCTCFFTLEESNARKYFLKAINSAPGSGGYMCQLHDAALNKYLMEITDEFKSQSRENAVGKAAATCQGLNAQNTWVLNEDLQLDQHGNQLGEDTTGFVWLGKFTSRYNVVPQKYAADIETPLRSESLSDVLKRLKKCSGPNFVPSFLYISSGVMLVHYSYCQERFQQCPTPLAVGPKGTGKTTAGKVFLSLVGQGKKKLARQLSEVECMQQSSLSSFPLVYDDPDNLSSIKSLINNFFNGQAKATTRGTLQPKTGCMFTLNTEKLSTLLNGFQEASRVVMMPFPKLLQSNPLSQQMEYERKLQRSLKSASSAVGVIVSVASKLDTDDKAVTDTIARVESILGQSVHHRILRNYTTLMLFATKIAEICPEESPDAKELWDFFSEQIRPCVEKYQVERVGDGACEVNTTVTSTSELVNFIEIVLGHLSDMDENEARKFVNPAVLCLGKLGYALAKTKVQNLLGKNYPLRPVLKAVEEGGLGEDNVIREFKSDIEGGKHKQRALTFRRTVIPSYLRKRLDEVLCYQPKDQEVDEESESRMEISVICSNNTRWLSQREMITALGEEKDGYFKVFYPLDSGITRGDEILLDGDENTTSAFPPGTKVTFSVVQTGQLDDQDQESVSDSTSESGNEDLNGDDDEDDDADMASTDGVSKGEGEIKETRNSSAKKKGELEKLGDGFVWFRKPTETSRKRTVRGMHASERTENAEKEALNVELAAPTAVEKRGKRRKRN